MLDRNIVVVDLEEYIALRRKAEELENRLKGLFSIGEAWDGQAVLEFRIGAFEEEIKQVLEESEFHNRYRLPLAHWEKDGYRMYDMLFKRDTELNNVDIKEVVREMEEYEEGLEDEE